MAVPKLKDAITIRSLIYYTLKTDPPSNRKKYWKRDVLRSKLRIIKKIVYHKVGPNVQFTTKYEIRSYSRPQYSPYTSIKGGNKKNQKITDSIEHTYPIAIQFSTNDKGIVTYDSQIRWRTGSFKKWVDKPSQGLIKSVYRETSDKIKLKLSKTMKGKSSKEINEAYEAEINKIRQKGKYLSVGDYNAQVNEVYGDGYFRDYVLQYSYNSLYGPLWYKEFPKDQRLKFPFADKHLWGVILALVKKGIIQVDKRF